MVKRVIMVPAILMLLSIATNTFGITIYVSSLVSSYKSFSNLTQESHKRKTEIISLLFKKELKDRSSEDISFKDIAGLEAGTTSLIGNEPITDNLDALAVCFFHNVDYVLYGELFIENDEKRYLASIKIYSKKAGDIVFTTDMIKNVSHEEEFVKALADRINMEFSYKYASIKNQEEQAEKERKVRLREERGEPEIAEKEKETEKEAEKEKEIEKKKEEAEIAFDKEEEDMLDKIETMKDKKSEKTERKEVAFKDGPDIIRTSTEKIMSFHISIGYFLTLLGEWKDVVFPCVSLEEGIKWSFLLVNTKKFDFYLRPGLLVDYSFAVQVKDNNYHRYVHYHSLTCKLLIEFFFEFGDVFGFFIGGCPHYKVDIIDFRTRSNNFYTDIPYAFGASGNIGFEFLLNKEKTFHMGINIVTNFTFYDSVYFDIKALSHLLIKI